MRTGSTLLGLTLVVLTATARAQEPAPPPPAAPPSPAAEPAVPPAAAVETTAAPSHRRGHVGLSFLPMGLGKIRATAGGQTNETDAAFGYAVGLSAGYEVISGFLVGIAPQAVYNGKIRGDEGEPGKEYDFLLKLAYVYPIVDVVTLYVELMPGYSIIYPATSGTSSGLVVAGGVGADLDLTSRFYLNVSAGYQRGFQTQNSTSNYRTDFIRVALGGGIKF